MINIKQEVRDGQSVLRYFHYAVVAVMISIFSAAAMAEKVNLNQADAETLQYIPGIGASKSADIVELREQTGGFKQYEDLLEVRGIGEKTLEVIKQFGTLEGGVSKLTQEMIDNPPSSKVSKAGSSNSLSSG